MPARVTRIQQAVDGVAFDQTATADLKIGLTFHQLLIDVSFTSSAKPTDAARKTSVVEELRLKMDGRIMWEVSGKHLEAMNIYDRTQPQGQDAALDGEYDTADTTHSSIGTGTNEMILLMSMDRSQLRTRAGQELTAVGTGEPQNSARGPAFNPTPISSFILEVKFAGSTDFAGATLSALKCKVLAVMSGSSPLGLIKKLRRFNLPATPAAGIVEIANLPLGDQINRMFLFGCSGVQGLTEVEKLSIQRDNFIMFERTPIQNLFIAKIGGEHNPGVGGFYSVDPTEAENGADTIVTAEVTDFRIILDVQASFTPILYVEYIGGLLGS